MSSKRGVHVFRGNEVFKVDLKKARANPADDLKSQPGGMIKFPEGFW